MATGISSLMPAMYAVNCVDGPYPRDAFWPVADRRVTGPVPATGAPPIVLLASTGDPAIPYSSGVSLSQQLPSSVLVTRNGDGHGSLGRGDACINAIADDYLLRLDVPAPGLACP